MVQKGQIAALATIPAAMMILVLVVVRPSFRAVYFQLDLSTQMHCSTTSWVARGPLEAKRRRRIVCCMRWMEATRQLRGPLTVKSEKVLSVSQILSVSMRSSFRACAGARAGFLSGCWVVACRGGVVGAGVELLLLLLLLLLLMPLPGLSRWVQSTATAQQLTVDTAAAAARLPRVPPAPLWWRPHTKNATAAVMTPLHRLAAATATIKVAGTLAPVSLLSDDC